MWGVMLCCRGERKNHPPPTLPLKGRALEAGLRGSDGGTSWRASVEQGVHAVDQSLRRAVAVDALGRVAGGEAAQEQVDGAAEVAGRIVDVAQAQAQPALHGDQVDQVLQVVVVGGDGLRAHGRGVVAETVGLRSEEHTSELQSLMRISYAGFCLKKKNCPRIGYKQ